MIKQYWSKNKKFLWIICVAITLFNTVIEEISAQPINNRELLSSYREHLQKGEFPQAKVLLQKMQSTMNNPFAENFIARTINKFPQIRMSPIFNWAKKIKHFFSLKKNTRPKLKQGYNLILENKDGSGDIFLSAMPFSSNESKELSGPFPTFANFFPHKTNQKKNPKADVYWISLPPPTELYNSYDNEPIKIDGIEVIIPFSKANEKKMHNGSRIYYAKVEPIFDHSASSAIDGRMLERKDFINIFNEAEKMRLDGSNVVINCAAGNARSSSILSSFLMEKHGFSLSESSKLIAKKRPQTRGFLSRNNYQKAFLVTYFLDKINTDSIYRKKFFEKSAEIIADDLFLCFTTNFIKVDKYQAGYSTLPMIQLSDLIKKLKDHNNINKEKHEEITRILTSKIKIFSVTKT
jgi:hypothetical protein